MALNRQIVLYCFLILNATLFVLNVPAWQEMWTRSNQKPLLTFTRLNTTTNSPKLRGSNHNQFLSKNVSENSAPIHPLDLLMTKFEQLDWDPERLDELTRKYWDAEKSFVRYFTDSKRNVHKILSTSCLHNAAWIVPALLKLEKRPNYYKGLFKIPEDKNLIVYKNTRTPRSELAAPVIESLRNFVNSRPSNESIVFQVDMHLNPIGQVYDDHHYNLHVFNGSISMYQAWQGDYSLVEYMKDPGMYKLRYPMPLETFLTHFERTLTYTEDEKEQEERIKSIWEIFGTTETLIYSRTKGAWDFTVRSLRYPWVVSLITHWPNSPLSELNQI